MYDYHTMHGRCRNRMISYVQCEYLLILYQNQKKLITCLFLYVIRSKFTVVIIQQFQVEFNQVHQN